MFGSVGPMPMTGDPIYFPNRGVPPAPPGMPAATQQWIERPPPMFGVPPGLEYLAQLNALVVREQPNWAEMFTGWTGANKYQITNSVGQQAYFAVEESSTYQRVCCGPNRGFTIHVVDNMNQEVMRVTREFKYCAGGPGGCFACLKPCAHEVQVESPPGVVIGYVREKCGFFKPKFDILDENMNPVLKIKGPTCIIRGCPCDNKFQITQLDGESQLGLITNKWNFMSGITHADNFGVEFPQDLSVKIKATLLGALFLIDFMFFEQPRRR